MRTFSLPQWSLLPLAVVCLLFVAYKRVARPTGYPGPPPWPIIGNILPSRRVWLKLAEYAKTYGPVYSLRILGTPVLVLNDARAARRLLEDKSALYANRNLPKMVELCGMDRGVVWEHNPARLRQARKLLHMVLQPRQLEEYATVLDRHVTILLQNLLRKPEDFIRHLQGVTAGVAMQISHGYEIRDGDDSYLDKANEFVENFADASLPGRWMVDWLPFLAWLPTFLPGMDFKRKARVWNAHYTSLAEEGHRMVKDRIAKGTAGPSLTYRALVESKPGEHSEDVIMFTATQVYTGGADTGFSTLASFILLMLEHPEIQLRAQAEIDRVIGSDRLPSYADRKSLPYVDAIMTEVLRLRPPINAVTRIPSQDDAHEGHVIEKDTLVIVNFWGMLNDETIYPDPLAFKPERWLSKDDKIRDENVFPLDVVFGFGRRYVAFLGAFIRLTPAALGVGIIPLTICLRRRICPGRYLAQQLVFTAMARTLALFRISHARTPEGDIIVPPGDYSEGGIVYPLPFKCAIEPRSAHSLELLENHARY
ncbi:cytochrome P450 [Pilatotrama ljubarskyi]|nr:cytochrome P450 [Pilatotrama ljubarskyi]